MIYVKFLKPQLSPSAKTPAQLMLLHAHETKLDLDAYLLVELVALRHEACVFVWAKSRQQRECDDIRRHLSKNVFHAAVHCSHRVHEVGVNIFLRPSAALDVVVQHHLAESVTSPHKIHCAGEIVETNRRRAY